MVWSVDYRLELWGNFRSIQVGFGVALGSCCTLRVKVEPRAYGHGPS